MMNALYKNSVNSDAEVNDQQASGDSVVQLLTATTWKKQLNAKILSAISRSCSEVYAHFVAFRYYRIKQSSFKQLLSNL